MTAPEPFLRSWSAPLLLRGARARGVDLAPLLLRHGLPADAADRSAVELGLAALRALGDALASAAGAPRLGLEVGATLPRGAYGLLEFCVRSSANLRAAIDRLRRFAAVVNPLAEMTLTTSAGEATFAERVAGEPLAAGAQVTELTLALYARIVREALGEPGWRPRRVAFVHPAPEDVAPLAAFFGAGHLRFEAPAFGFTVAAGDLDRSFASADEPLARVLEEQLARELAARPAPVDLVAVLRGRVRDRIASEGIVSLPAIAAELGLSARAAQRRLKDRGATFAGLVDEARRDLALLLVPASSGELKTIAARLGYADVRVFARAFRRWTGASPRAFRDARRRP